MQDLHIKNITASEAWEILSQNEDAFLIDVRTTNEWEFIGIPDISELNKETKMISWRQYPDMEINAHFIDNVTNAVNHNKNAKLLLICRSGKRSYEGACILAKEGYKNIYNILGGFEGDKKASDHKEKYAGWKAENLKWRQG